MDAGMPSQWFISSTRPMTPPSVMAARWWMLWMPKDKMAVPSTSQNNRFSVKSETIFLNDCIVTSHTKCHQYNIAA